MRTLITGVRGFVGGHLARQLLERGEQVSGIGRGEAPQDLIKAGLVYEQCAFDDTAAIRSTIERTQSDVIVHLAGTRSGPSPADVYRANVVGSAYVLDAAASCGRPVRVVVVGSSAMYGAASDRIPLTEDAPVCPVTPYGVSKACADLMAHQVHVSTALPIMRARPFNIIGPGQRGDYFTAVCARQLAEIECGRAPPVVKLGNLSAYRDFIDVRDLVHALIAIAERGQSGAAYNVCSGTAVSIRAVVDQLCEMAKTAVTIDSAPPRNMSNDVPFQVGSFAKLHADTGWEPRITLRDTLSDVLDDWRREVG